MYILFLDMTLRFHFNTEETLFIRLFVDCIILDIKLFLFLSRTISNFIRRIVMNSIFQEWYLGRHWQIELAGWLVGCVSTVRVIWRLTTATHDRDGQSISMREPKNSFNQCFKQWFWWYETRHPVSGGVWREPNDAPMVWNECESSRQIGRD